MTTTIRPATRDDLPGLGRLRAGAERSLPDLEWAVGAGHGYEGALGAPGATVISYGAGSSPG